MVTNTNDGSERFQRLPTAHRQPREGKRLKKFPVVLHESASVVITYVICIVRHYDRPTCEMRNE